MMNVEPKELLMKMKEYDFIYDTSIGKVVNKEHEEDKEYVFKILDLLYENFDRVRYADDLSDTVIGKKKWTILISQKFAMMDKRIPVPQVPLHMTYDRSLRGAFRGKQAYLMLVGVLKETEEEIYVSLNFKDEEYRKVFKKIAEYKWKFFKNKKTK
ncbi:hypothetical protein [Peribacillus simplex]|uniref:hypothetical protein n=1 Tax=Peribacillus simplex TaxID=1478 RepID=UPI001A9323DC|nr:hypothetical protein [Peribacillus simplex]